MFAVVRCCFFCCCRDCVYSYLMLACLLRFWLAGFYVGCSLLFFSCSWLCLFYLILYLYLTRVVFSVRHCLLYFFIVQFLISLSIHTHFFPILIGFGNVPAFVALCSFVRDICAIASVSCVVRHCAAVGFAAVVARCAAVFLLSDFRLIGSSPSLFAASSCRLIQPSSIFPCLFVCLLLGILLF